MSIFSPEPDGGTDLDILDFDGMPRKQSGEYMPDVGTNPGVYPVLLATDSRGSTVEQSGGLRLRDYLAAEALAGLIAAGERPTFTRDAATHLARQAYKVADAMLAVRREGQVPHAG